MKRFLTLTALSLAALAATGCPHVDPGPAVLPSPGASASPSLPGVGSGVFRFGSQWVYDVDSAIGDQAHQGEITINVQSVAGETATLQTVTRLDGLPAQTATSQVSTSGDPFLTLSNPTGGEAPTLVSSDSRDVTVPAGTFPGAVHRTLTLTTSQGASIIEQWVSERVGLLEQIVITKPTQPEGAPAGFPTTITTHMRLKSHTP